MHSNLHSHTPNIKNSPGPVWDQDTQQLPVTEPIARKPRSLRQKQLPIALLALGGIIAALIFLWQDSNTPRTDSLPAASSLSTIISATPTRSHTTSMDTGAGHIQVYVVGAVNHPGVYSLPTNARVYDLLKAAGGTKDEANLAFLNLAARLNDGQEVYVTINGETPPAQIGGVSGPNGQSAPVVNINSATQDDLVLQLHLSATMAKKIVDYRTAHGRYNSPDQLLLVISQTTYNKIKNQVTI